MKSQDIILLHTPKRGYFGEVWAGLMLVFALCWSPSSALAKSASLMAIEVYGDSTGAAYLEIVDVLINTKSELRDCSSIQGTAVDKSAYGKMLKIPLSAGAVLERDPNGVLRYSATEGHTVCVVPDNVKFEHNAVLSLSDLADQAKLTGTPVAGASTAIPPIQKGVKVVFVATQDHELAEYLLAQRSASIAGWKNYLSKFASSLHSTQAKQELASLYVATGEASLHRYQSSAASASPAYKDLKDAQTQAGLALAVLPGQEQAVKLLAEVRKELTAIAGTAREELQAYNTALQSQTAGYVHLQNARRLSDALNGIDLGFQPVQPLLADVMKASNSFDATLRSAEASVVEKQMDNAIKTISPLISFSTEEPRIPAVIDAAYGYYLQLGKQSADSTDWTKAIEALNKAKKLKDTKEVEDALEDAHKQLTIAQDKAAVDKALAASKDYEAQHDILNAFETLYFLPPSQKALVADDLERLKNPYVQVAVKTAKTLQVAHGALGGLGDEIGVEEAYTYLQRAHELTNDDSYKDTMDVLAEELSKYFVARAKLYLAKPSGSGTELGWVYLEEALSYLRSNQEAHDTVTSAEPAHAMHSKLSLRVHFRDQTSLRQSSDFIGQLEDSVASNLEAPTIKAVRFTEATGGVEPDFQLAGDVLEHQTTATPTVASKESEYRAGTHEDPNEEWNKANRAFADASRNLQTDQSALQGAEAKGNKKEVTGLNAKIEKDRKAVSDAQTTVDSLPRTVTKDIVRPYNYTQRTIDVRNALKLQFRIGQTLSGQLGEPAVVAREDRKQHILIEDVKADDTKGMKPSGTMPDTQALQTALDNSAREDLIRDVKARVSDLPKVIYSEAMSKEQGENFDGAGEYYLRFLSCTSDDGSAERKHAKEFLVKNFNMDLDAGVLP